MIIEAKNVSIRYIVGDFRDIGLKDYVIQKLKGNYKVREFWAVKNVSFSLEKGDMLGIVGKKRRGQVDSPESHYRHNEAYCRLRRGQGQCGCAPGADIGF